jgi:hypothetical protein
MLNRHRTRPMCVGKLQQETRPAMRYAPAARGTGDVDLKRVVAGAALDRPDSVP